MDDSKFTRGRVFRPRSLEDDHHPHLCIDGKVFLTYIVESFDDLDGEVEKIEIVPCRRCCEEREDA